MTVVEIVVVLGITLIVMAILIRFISTGHPISKATLLQTRSTETARIQLKRIAKAIREARESETGAYPLVDMLPQRLVFYADIDADDSIERVRYELKGVNLERGIIEPAGDPATYDPDNEQVNIVAGSIVNDEVDVFTYYSGDYPADTTPLSPIDLTEVKYIQFFLMVDDKIDADPPPIEVRSQVQIRNLKENLGEAVGG